MPLAGSLGQFPELKYSDGGLESVEEGQTGQARGRGVAQCVRQRYICTVLTVRVSQDACAEELVTL